MAKTKDPYIAFRDMQKRVHDPGSIEKIDGEYAECRDDRGMLHNPIGPAVKSKAGTYYYLDNRLHRPDGPAVIGEFGTKDYYWRGLRVPPWAIEKKWKLTLDFVLHVENVELRRTFFEIAGWERMLDDPRVQVLDVAKLNDREMKLLKIEQDGDEDIYLLQVVDATEHNGEFKKYVLRVPPRSEMGDGEMRSAMEAVAWTWGLKPEEYNPITEA